MNLDHREAPRKTILNGLVQFVNWRFSLITLVLRMLFSQVSN
jgi:hypothetical protein